LSIPCSNTQCACQFPLSKSIVSPGPGPGRVSRVGDPRSLLSTVADSDPTRSTARLISGAPGAGQAGASNGVSRSGQVRPLSLNSYNCHVHGSYNGHESPLFVAVQEVGITIPSSRPCGACSPVARGTLSPLPLGLSLYGLRRVCPVLRIKKTRKDQYQLSLVFV